MCCKHAIFRVCVGIKLIPSPSQEDHMNSTVPQDNRQYFMLPQASEGGG
jgi:hypothetical protein